MTRSEVRSATSRDWEAIAQLLSRRSLPLEGGERHLSGFVVAMSGEQLVGVAGVERYGDIGLLRSVAVNGDQAGTGVGTALVEEVLRRARSEGLTALYLLTTTASSWFPRFGFQEVDRSALPGVLSDSAELQGACPATATTMRLVLPPSRPS